MGGGYRKPRTPSVAVGCVSQGQDKIVLWFSVTYCPVKHHRSHSVHFALAALAAGRGQATGAVGLAALDPDCPLLVLSQLSDSYTYSRVIAKIQVLNPCQVRLRLTN